VNELTIAVAGARKTQGVVDTCAAAAEDHRILVLAFTQASQSELDRRIHEAAPLTSRVEVLGWYAFLLRHFIRPYLPLLFPGRALAGFNYEGDPGQYASGAERHFDSQGRAYQRYLASLAHKVHEASQGSVVDRLEHIYTDVYIDEAQDIGGWSLEILDVLFKSKLNVHLVGDIRQALLSTDPRDRKNSGFKFDKVLAWYREREDQNILTINEVSTTHRSNQVIATLSDEVFDPQLAYSPTVSASSETDPHVGLWRVAPEHVLAYVEAYAPLSLHWRSDLGADLGVSFTTFGMAKGRTVGHVLILPTAKMRTFLSSGSHLEGRPACALYVGITRAEHSVAFILEPQANAPRLSAWSPDS